ncbi:hypothetical protein QP027_00555 [Corynebacterium breve]|uniref:YhgE/Pip domain-containing protein n=1 Tax=Corynebacterium breve TaxID=3049799 RepID=A0ABY8VFQ0_9CORY|nr:hypothetical protein [Corynebacterium breve]WIM67927.1 hypothetical protein QP027_00555 [Corynebacterium breve]
MNPASTWTSGEQIAGAPPTQLGPDELVDARRAAGEANTQTGFLTTGTEDLADGAEDLRDGMIDLADGAEDARQGASDLAVGMNSLQGGMGELGSGANSVADGVGTAVDTVVGFEAIKGQIIAAIDRTLDGTNGATDQQVIDARDALTGLRGDVEVAQLPEDTVTQLNELKDGSREVANQLTLEGYGFYDGMVAATGGANTLSTGMVELRDGANTARDGAQELYDGAEKVDTIAGNTKDKVDAVQRAIPAASPMTVAEGAEEVPDSALSHGSDADRSPDGARWSCACSGWLCRARFSLDDHRCRLSIPDHHRIDLGHGAWGWPLTCCNGVDYGDSGTGGLGFRRPDVDLPRGVRPSHRCGRCSAALCAPGRCRRVGLESCLVRRDLHRVANGRGFHAAELGDHFVVSRGQRWLRAVIVDRPLALGCPGGGRHGRGVARCSR